MDFVIDNVRTFLAAMIYIRMFGVLDSTHTSSEVGIVLRTYTLGKYIMYIENMGSGLGIEISIHDTANSMVYRYYAVTNKNLIRIFELPDDKFIMYRY